MHLPTHRARFGGRIFMWELGTVLFSHFHPPAPPAAAVKLPSAPPRRRAPHGFASAHANRNARPPLRGGSPRAIMLVAFGVSSSSGRTRFAGLRPEVMDMPTACLFVSVSSWVPPMFIFDFALFLWTHVVIPRQCTHCRGNPRPFRREYGLPGVRIATSLRSSQ